MARRRAGSSTRCWSGRPTPRAGSGPTAGSSTRASSRPPPATRAISVCSTGPATTTATGVSSTGRRSSRHRRSRTPSGRAWASSTGCRRRRRGPGGRRGFPSSSPVPTSSRRWMPWASTRTYASAGGSGLARPYSSRRYRPIIRAARAAHFEDSVGVGFYPIDIHNSGPDDVGVSCRTRPFQIPMGALIPVRLRNLLAGAKNLGATHITNGCYRLHPVEWNVGEAAGILAAHALETGRDPAAIHAETPLRRDLHRRLVGEGVPLVWFTDVGVAHPRFAELQMAAVSGEVMGAPDSLEAAALPRAARARLGL